MKHHISAQILIVTLIVLMLVSITVVVITATVAKNNRQVFNNIEYERSYNRTETIMLDAVDVLSDPGFDLFDLRSLDGRESLGADECEQRPTGEYYCTYTQDTEPSKTLLSIEETNIVEAYDLGVDEYFDVILFDEESDPGFRDTINIKWLGETALELTLIYRDPSGELANIKDVVDPTFGNSKVYSTTGDSNSGFLTTRINPPASSNEGIRVDLSTLDSSKVPNNARLRYLRVKVVNRAVGTAISIQPVDNDSLPDQVRKIEAFSYSLTNAESSAPVIYTQLPLSPPTPAIIEDVAIYNAVTTATCGDGVIQAGEFCDDGNTNPNDGCTNNCESPICSLNAGESGTNNDYISDIFYAPVDFDLHFGFNSQYYSDRLMIEISDSSSFTNTQVLYDSGCHSSDVAAFNLPGISRGRKQACGEGSRWDGNTLPFTIPRDKYFRVIVMNGVDWCGQPSTAWSLSIRCEQVSLFASSCCPVCTGGCEGC